MAEDSNEFHWDNIFFVKVEDKVFCVPRCEFVQSSEVFADMFLLPSGPATPCEGQDKDHPIVLEGYKKDEFACLLKVMYPTARSLISSTKLELHLKKEEWVSVLKLSTMWNMTKIRQYAIHMLSTTVTLSPIEKILLARAHRVGAWLNGAVTSLTVCNPMPTLEDLAPLGWDTVARILWIRDNCLLISQHSRCFRRDAIKCAYCAPSPSLINSNYGCGHIASGDAKLTFGSALQIPGSYDLLVTLKQIQCPICGGNPFSSISVVCSNSSCLFTYNSSNNPNLNVRVTPNKSKTLGESLKMMIEEMFGEEIKGYEPNC